MKPVIVALFLAAMPVAASADAKAPQSLLDKQCTACHVRQVGGDGSSIYTRKDSIIHSLAAPASILRASAPTMPRSSYS